MQQQKFPQQKKRLTSKNPFTGEIRHEFDYATDQQLQKKIKYAEKGFEKQKSRTLQERAEIIGNMAKVFQQHKLQVAEMITFQMGKPITQSIKEVQKTIAFAKYFSTHYDPLKPKKIQHTGSQVKTEIVYKPLGIVYLIVPYNFPLYLTFKGGITTLLAGNCLLTKTSSCCPMLGQLIEKLMRKAGFNHGEYQCIHASYDMLDKILEHKSIAGVSFTGSTNAGAKISAKAGKYLKKSVMELGGNDPFVVLKDADLQKAVQKAIKARTMNCGQICFSPKRFIIEEPLYEKFRQKLIDGLKNIKYGDPKEKFTELGPLAKESLHDLLDKQIKELPKSYKIFWQRQNVKRPFYPITIIEGGDGKQVYDEEMFGPIFTLFRARDEKHAIEIANQGEYGLGGQVFSKEHGQEVIDQIRCGMGFVNQFVKSDYSFPSGGVGKSGYGRQCGEEGYKEFTNVKVHYIC